MLAAAEADLDLQPVEAGGEGRAGVGAGGFRKAQPRQRGIEQQALARPQRMAAAAPVQPIR